MNLVTPRIEIKVDHAKITVSDRTRLRAIQMKAEADGISIDQFCEKLASQTRQYYQMKLYPTKLGPDKAFKSEKGKWRIENIDGSSQPYTLKNVLEANLYTHIRAYLMGLAMSEITKDRKERKLETVILRDDNRVAIVKDGKLQLHSSDDWFRTHLKKRARRES